MNRRQHLMPAFDNRLTALILLGGLALGSVQAQPATEATTTGQKAATRISSPYKPSRFPKRAEMYYGDVWGVDSLSVKSTESGELIRFSYRVLNAAKAVPLNDKKSQPKLVDLRAG